MTALGAFKAFADGFKKGLSGTETPSSREEAQAERDRVKAEREAERHAQREAADLAHLRKQTEKERQKAANEAAAFQGRDDLESAMKTMKARNYDFPVKKETSSLALRLRPAERVEAVLTGNAPVGPGLTALTSERVIMIASELLGSGETYREWPRATVVNVMAAPKSGFMNEAKLMIAVEGEALLTVENVVEADAERFVSKFSAG